MKINSSTFKALRVEETDGVFTTSIKNLEFSSLQPEEIRVKVCYTSLNYKDALSASGNKGVTRQFPHTPGIDAVGFIAETNDDRWQVNDRVIVTSYDLGMNTDGGFAEYITVPGSWAVKLPKNLEMKEAMIIGTAGLTAGMSILRLTALVKPEAGSIVVSGATGGVGALSVAILSKLGYNVVAITGKASEMDFLKEQGASEIILRSEIENYDKKPLLKPQFAGGIDTVGGVILENIIKATQPMGVVTSCGNVASPKLELTVFPFILRGVTLIGIDSQNYPMAYRTKVWETLATDWKLDFLDESYSEITLEGVAEKIQQMLKGQLKGRTLIKIAG